MNNQFERIALIDGDIIIFTLAHAYEVVTDENTIRIRTNNYVNKLIIDSKSDSYIMYVGGTNNFRKQLSDTYKANRKDRTLPRWFDVIKDQLEKEWNAVIVNNIETDDALSITQTYYNDLSPSEGKTIICSKDKDLLQVSGLHYRIPANKTILAKIINVSPTEAYHSLMIQALMGDSTDNITGIPKVGEVKAHKTIEDLPEYNMLEAVIRRYIKHYGTEQGLIEFWKNYNLVKLLTSTDYSFVIPQPNSLIKISTLDDSDF